MLRRYFPEWLKCERVEFSLELLAGVIFGFSLVTYLLG